MDPTLLILTIALAGSAVAIATLVRRSNGNNASAKLETQGLAEKIINHAEREADMLRKAAELEIKDQHLSIRNEIESREKKVHDRELVLAETQATLDSQKDTLASEAEQLSAEQTALTQALEKTAGLTAEAAKQELIAQIESDARFESAKQLQSIDDETKATAEERARHVISSTIQRIAGDFVVESTVTAVALPSDDMKGRIIGREGRNIRALEAATGVNLIVDDTPETILLSSFDPLRRKIAHDTLVKLMADGRFHPTRIEETVEKVSKKLDAEMLEEANKVVFELDVHDLHPEVLGLLGRLKYRLSYGQNNLSHAREVALICGMMADELGLDRKLAVRGGLLHDIGKVLTQDQQGPHAELGAEFAARHGEQPNVVNAIASHHGDVPPSTKEAYLVAAGDALSAGRPGARRESMELYIKRLSDLEGVAETFPGVEKVYAMQAGREVRVMVDADTLSDAECAMVSRDIAKKIEQDVTYPGQVKVCLVRESRFIEYAK